MTHHMSRTASTSHTDWCNFISGGAAADIDIDADGEMPNTRILVDLTQALSQRLGRQMSQMSTYRVDSISIHLVNVNDLVDNDSAANFGGRIHYWSPTQHRIDAMQLARQTEKAFESADIDNDSWLLSTDNDYKGMRFNWDADQQIVYATQEGFTALAGNEWDFAELFQTYGIMEGMPTQTNALWSNSRAGYPNQLGWTASYQNESKTADALDDHTLYVPNSSPFQATGLNLEVLGGLLMIDVESSSTDDIGSIVDDDYQILVTIGVTGWSDF